MPNAPVRRAEAAGRRRSRTSSTAARPNRSGSAASPAPTARPRARSGSPQRSARTASRPASSARWAAAFRGALDADANTTPDALELHRTAAPRCSSSGAQRGGDGSVLARPGPGPRQRRRASTARCSPTFRTTISTTTARMAGLRARPRRGCSTRRACSARCSTSTTRSACSSRSALAARAACARSATASRRDARRWSRVHRSADSRASTSHRSSWGRADAAAAGARPLQRLQCARRARLPGRERHSVRRRRRRCSASLPPVPGRMQRGRRRRPLVVVDYAHTPGRARQGAAALRPVAEARGGRLAVVFGAGGDRDPTKRPPMGAVAARARRPRRAHLRQPAQRRSARHHRGRSAQACPRPCAVEPDRARGDRRARSPRPTHSDVVLIAGKGHEAYQEIAGQALPFSDAAQRARPRSSERGEDDDEPGRSRRGARRARASGGDALLHRRVHRQRAASRQGELFVAHPRRALRRPRIPRGGSGSAARPRAMVDSGYRRRASAAACWSSTTRSARSGDLGALLARALRAGAGRDHRLERQDHHQGDARGDPARSTQATTRVLATRGNLNNDIGLPLTLLGLRAAHRYCAIELGMNHQGEIAYARRHRAADGGAGQQRAARAPRIHALGRGGRGGERVAFTTRCPPTASRCINADDAQAGLFRSRAGKRRTRRVRPGPGARGHRRATQLEPLSSDIRLRTPAGEAEATLAIPGLHNVRNALAAAACAHAAGITASSHRRKGSRRSVPTPADCRSSRRPAAPRVIDDSYNANPDSVRAAIDVLGVVPGADRAGARRHGRGRRAGPAVPPRGRRATRARRASTQLLAIGEATRDTVAAFGTGARHFVAVEELLPPKSKRKPSWSRVPAS